MHNFGRTPNKYLINADTTASGSSASTVRMHKAEAHGVENCVRAMHGHMHNEAEIMSSVSNRPVPLGGPKARTARTLAEPSNIILVILIKKQ